MSDIFEKARSIARNMTYNESAVEAAAKHIIFELCAELEVVKRERDAGIALGLEMAAGYEIDRVFPDGRIAGSALDGERL